ncbi:MAG: hypothetical protein KMY53_09320 [Desulfarculus sp.]|nr:hypothetical protein [Pseudomonadota bacterium]MBV1716846.1 hypothetical protein [Desulfarculus sp.]MBU4576183.1 hypothetical protein [Pseudomonadota bacterium]MBU4598902.1 hypothetical protein [Pseudomonadota bacterium]MBV1738349.1 hypothetical protein [Desulfarculus sp.]
MFGCLGATMLLMILLTAAQAPAAQRWQGSIQGLACVTQGKVCPINMEDPLIALEKTFVLLLADGSWYYLPNLDRAILARHLNRPVAVEGVLEAGSKAIMVNKLLVKRGDDWREAWSPEMERELLEQLQGWGQGKRE